ncbi:MAG: YceI family protein [Bacteroidota bacterium]
MFRYLILLIFFLLHLVASAQVEQLIVFTQTADQLFQSQCLPKLKAYAEQEGIELIQRDLTAGLPVNISTTPAVVFQNGKGRSVYAGRYTEFNTFINFIRTSRIVPQRQAAFIKENVLVRQIGRAQTIVPIKFTALGGEKQNDWQPTDVLRSLEAGMMAFQYRAKTEAARTDRLYYLDLHPYCDQNQMLSVSVALFSQFSCIEPIFQRFEQPFRAPYAEKDRLFQQIGKAVSQEIQKSLQASPIGDAYQAVADNTPVQSWEALDLALPATITSSTQIDYPDQQAIPSQWVFSGPINDRIPALQFRFMEPLERYSGEVRTLSGSLSLQDQQVQSISFTAQTRSMTMGMESLDQKVLKSYLKAKKYPRAHFSLDKVLAQTALSWGESTTIELMGQLQLLRYKRPVQVSASLIPTLSAAGEPELIVQASFPVNITDNYGIKGPDGPSPANKTILIDLNFIMKAASPTTTK